MNQSPITIIGGGLAGLTLGIGLRQHGVPVTLWEAGRYPRHRVCGEFISGRGQDSLARLGLLEKFQDAGARPATTAAFFSEHVSTPARALPEPALCLSRHIMDELLAREFRALGGDLRENERYRGQESGPGIVRASGRRAQATDEGWRLFGLKAHVRKVSLTADLEMHLSSAGYVGLCRLSRNEVNVCGLFRSAKPVPDLAEKWKEWLGGPIGSPLHQRLAKAEFDENSFCSIAGLSLQQHRAAGSNECSIGDALTMIPPVTGNGMSMAFESAELAIEPLVSHSRGGILWEHAARRIAGACDAAFARRLHWAALLQRGMLTPRISRPLLWLAPRCGWLWRGLFWRTR
jgi:2-polyprenyl-6-methoxyphenol hydroxylase-like FAD-dependent oxidoreductase